MSVKLTPLGASKFSAAKRKKLDALVLAGASDAAIDAAVAEGKKNWTTRRETYAARVRLGLLPNLAGEPITARAVDSLRKEYPTLRDYAYPIVFGYEPTRAAVSAIVGRSKKTRERYVGRGRKSAAYAAKSAA